MKTEIIQQTILELAHEAFADMLTFEIANTENSTETRNHLDFISTLLHLGKTDEYELKFVVEAMLQGWSGKNISIVKPRESFVQTMSTLISDAKDYRSITSTSSYEEVVMWYERGLPFVPESINSKAKRLLEAAEYYSDKG